MYGWIRRILPAAKTDAVGVIAGYRRLSLFYFLYFAFIGGLAPFFPLYLQHKGFDPYEVGSLMAILMLTKIVAPNLWGWVADHYGHRLRLIRLGSLFAAGLFAVLLSVSGFWTYAILLASFSAFWNAVLPQTEVVTLSALKAEPQRYAGVRLWGSVGFIITVNVLGVLLDLISITWLGPWLLACLALLFLNSLFLPEEPVRKDHNDDRRFLDRVWQADVWPFFVIVMLLQLSFGPYYTFFSIHLESLGYERLTIGLLWSLGVLCEIILFTRMSDLLKRYSLRSLLLVSLVATALRWVGIGFLADSLWILLPLQALHALSFGVVHAASIDFVRRVFGAGSAGQGQAMYSAASFGLGGALGAWGAGWLFSDFGAGATFLAGAVAAGAASVLTGLPALRRSRLWARL